MKTSYWQALRGVLLLACLVANSHAEEVGRATADRVNVRGQPTIASEVITQLRTGDTVRILEEIKLSQPKPDEPADWLRIALPTNLTVWVHGDFIDPETKAVRGTRLNLRAGPGENYSVLGRIERGAVVNVLRVSDNWVEIEPPAGSHAFVAAEFISREAAPAKVDTVEVVKAEPPVAPVKPEPAPVPEPTPEIPVTQIEIVEVPSLAEPPIITQESFPGGAPAVLEPEIVAAPPALVPSPVEVAPELEEEPPVRIVKREGMVRRSLSLRAPAPYVLEDPESGRQVNFLHSDNPDINFKQFSGFRVIVTGEEAVDPRWPRTPLIKVQTIQLP